MSPVVPPIPVKADVPAEHTLVLTVAAEQEDAAKAAHLLPDQAALEVLLPAGEVQALQAAVVVPVRLVPNVLTDVVGHAVCPVLV